MGCTGSKEADEKNINDNEPQDDQIKSEEAGKQEKIDKPVEEICNDSTNEKEEKPSENVEEDGKVEKPNQAQEVTVIRNPVNKDSQGEEVRINDAKGSKTVISFVSEKELKSTIREEGNDESICKETIVHQVIKTEGTAKGDDEDTLEKRVTIETDKTIKEGDKEEHKHSTRIFDGEHVEDEENDITEKNNKIGIIVTQATDDEGVVSKGDENGG
ncbi:unnamed protein product [Dimorphilus gyrociliatus]|uniref:Uncharacterized protein n=1 Tax=Dimorphilus gyrociliatus TaxID=2664684 RepID=A0A7I8VEE8_9ANNE|nr:unnamed protein product [Dimorphilus gyrociliatus]